LEYGANSLELNKINLKMSLGALSNELLTRIIEFVTGAAGDALFSTHGVYWVQLHNIPFVSRRFYAIATNVLHQNS
jgi:hypothetical protein